MEKELSFLGDKSIAHRLILISILLEQKITINNLPTGKDVLTSLNIAKQLGVKVSTSTVPNQIVLLGGLKNKKYSGEITLDCENSGTTARLICGILANLNGRFKLIGDKSLSKRPMDRVVKPLADLMNVNIKSTNGYFPIYIEANGKAKSIDFYNTTGSAQVKSAVLFAGLAGDKETTVRESIPSRDHTERLLIALSTKYRKICSQESSLRAKGVAIQNISLFHRHINKYFSEIKNNLEFYIPGDVSSAAYFVVAAVILNKTIVLKNLLLNPTRTGFVKVLKRMGAKIEEVVTDDTWERVGDIVVKGGNLVATEIKQDEIPSLIDELPILAIAMAFAKGTSKVFGASELRVKESDRISCLISQLKKAGIDCKEHEDGYEITGLCNINSAELNSFKDHRLAMSFSILEYCSKVKMNIIGSESVNISFPEFYDYLGQTH